MTASLARFGAAHVPGQSGASHVAFSTFEEAGDGGRHPDCTRRSCSTESRFTRYSGSSSIAAISAAIWRTGLEAPTVSSGHHDRGITDPGLLFCPFPQRRPPSRSVRVFAWASLLLDLAQLFSTSSVFARPDWPPMRTSRIASYARPLTGAAGRYDRTACRWTSCFVGACVLAQELMRRHQDAGVQSRTYQGEVPMERVPPPPPPPPRQVAHLHLRPGRKPLEGFNVATRSALHRTSRARVAPAPVYKNRAHSPQMPCSASDRRTFACSTWRNEVGQLHARPRPSCAYRHGAPFSVTALFAFLWGLPNVRSNGASAPAAQRSPAPRRTAFGRDLAAIVSRSALQSEAGRRPETPPAGPTLLADAISVASSDRAAAWRPRQPCGTFSAPRPSLPQAFFEM